MAVPAQTLLQHLTLTEPGYAETADGRFCAYQITSKFDGTYWIVKDCAGWFFKGSSGRVDTLEAAESYVAAWVSQLTAPGVTNLVLSTPRYAETRDGRFSASRTDGAWTVTDRQGQFQCVTCDDLAYADQIIGELLAEQPQPTDTTEIAPHCGWHHRPTDQCPPFKPELGDLIPDLAGRGVNIQLIPAGLFPERCEDCIAVDGPVLDAVAVVCHKAPSEPLPDGWTYRAHVCGVHLRSNVTWELRRGCQTWVEIPVEFGQVAA